MWRFRCEVNDDDACFTNQALLMKDVMQTTQIKTRNKVIMSNLADGSLLHNMVNLANQCPY